jgi:nicotinamide mononucleotide (NMN) deamidase PncC
VGLAVVAAQEVDDQPAGTVFMHLDIRGEQHAQTVSLPGDRARFRNYAVINVLNFLRKTLTAL